MGSYEGGGEKSVFTRKGQRKERSAFKAWEATFPEAADMWDSRRANICNRVPVSEFLFPFSYSNWLEKANLLCFYIYLLGIS